MRKLIAIVAALALTVPSMAQLTPEMGRTIDADGRVKNDISVVVRPDRSGNSPTVVTNCVGTACATAARQDTGNTSLAAIANRTTYTSEYNGALTASQTFSGGTVNSGTGTQAYTTFTCEYRSNAVSATGGVQVQKSVDGTTWLAQSRNSLQGTVKPMTVTVPVLTQYHRCLYVNGATASTSTTVDSALGAGTAGTFEAGVSQFTQPALTTITNGAGVGTLSISAQTVHSLNLVSGATAGFFVLYDSATDPADGALTASQIRWCQPWSANTGDLIVPPNPWLITNGIQLFFSSTSCTTKASASYGLIAVQYR